MKREIVFLWTSGQETGGARVFLIRLGQGVGEIKLKISEEEAKDLFGQMDEYREEWKEGNQVAK